jgi:hypothetical protein
VMIGVLHCYRSLRPLVAKFAKDALEDSQRIHLANSCGGCGPTPPALTDASPSPGSVCAKTGPAHGEFCVFFGDFLSTALGGSQHAGTADLRAPGPRDVMGGSASVGGRCTVKLERLEEVRATGIAQARNTCTPPASLHLIFVIAWPGVSCHEPRPTTHEPTVPTVLEIIA